MSERSGAELMNEVYTRRGLATAVHLDLTYRCNFRCVHCVHGSSPDTPPPSGPELTTDKWIAVLDQLQQAKVFQLTLSGGEIGVREDLFTLLRAARERAFDIILKTNGSFLTPRRARELVAIGIRRVDVTLFSMEPEVNDRITMRKGSLPVVLRAIDAALDAGMNLKVSVPIMTLNVASAEATIRALRARSIPVNIGYNIHGDCEPGDPRWDLNAPPKELDALIPTFRSIQDFEPRPKMGDDTRSCKAGGGALYIGPDGEVKPCVVMLGSFGNLSERSFSEILASQARRDFVAKTRRDWKGCEGCVARPYCPFCMAEAERLTGDPFKRHPFMCRGTMRALRVGGGRRVGRDYVFEPAAGAPGEER